MIQSAYNTLVFRQRVMVLLAFLAVFYFLWDTLVFMPAADATDKAILTQTPVLKKKPAVITHKSHSRASKTMDQKHSLLTTDHSILKRELKDLDRRIDGYQSVLVPANKRLDIIQQILSANHYITIESLTELPIETYSTRLLLDSGTKTIAVEKSTVNIQFLGAVDDVLSYIQRIESLEWPVFLVSLAYDGGDKASVNLELVFYSVSEGKRDV